MFTIVNKKNDMKTTHQHLAAFSLLIGIITLILTAYAVSEKSHEEHLPERTDREGSSFSPVFLAGLCMLSSGCTIVHTLRHRNTRIRENLPLLTGTCCRPMAGRAMAM